MKKEFIMSKVVFMQYGSEQSMFFENMYPLEARKEWDYMYRVSSEHIYVVSVGMVDEYDWVAHQAAVRAR